MSEPVIQVEKPGLLTTIQDAGRAGYQQYGIVVSGAMDPFAVRAANLLAGNKETEAALEVTMMGPKLKFLKDTVIAIGGADLSASVDGREILPWKSVLVKKDEVLSFGAPKSGVRAYLAVAGGINSEPLLGSRSTYLKAGMGGIEGRELYKGDILEGGVPGAPLKNLAGRVLKADMLPDYQGGRRIRVVPGPDDWAFTDEGTEAFYSGEYELTRDVDRMGYRLSGPVVEHKDKADILSDAVTMGTVQVPSSGQPIILLADRQTSGGYTRIGTVISVDLPLLAQMHSGSTIMFERISVEKAQELYRNREKALKKLALAAGI